ncbi:CRISPR-associated endonuclease Cas1 [Sporolituus thermophilus]|uniref:CRISPR-associated endonuclease Cas1 n=1 Tax=Sporolituus thermophilus DSM 23256 TaxID=1123285 RepID=A0A1G7P3B9_9FIRM|nr:CRISPR-associated endonuclease Cas1 [Sporolituus thermophilus]SDF80731.1 CRISPR-associated protein, Cas1 family [Sporolituus thermophilus DSM 23256]
MHLFISNYGAFIGKKSERLMVKENGKVVGEYPFHDLEHITIDSLGVTISSDAIKECSEHGITISFMTPGGDSYALLYQPTLNGTVLTRREQLFAYRDERGIEMAKCFVNGKIGNQINTVKYFAKYRKTANPEEYKAVCSLVDEMAMLAGTLPQIKGTCIDEVRGSIMALEGRISNLYWECVKLLFSGNVQFPGREHRGAQDPVNSLLNYGYAILANQVERALVMAGLDPFGGFLHVDRPGKKSLVYDFIEEFRQPVVDRAVIAAVNKGMDIKIEDGLLDLATRKSLAAKIIERLEASERFQGRKQSLKTIIQAQARRIATFLRGEAKYKPFICGW